MALKVWSVNVHVKLAAASPAQLALPRRQRQPRIHEGGQRCWRPPTFRPLQTQGSSRQVSSVTCSRRPSTGVLKHAKTNPRLSDYLTEALALERAHPVLAVVPRRDE